LSYIFNNFEGTRAFSDVVAEAKEAGYTEPDPRDDLSGTDVARKVDPVSVKRLLNIILILSYTLGTVFSIYQHSRQFLIIFLFFIEWDNLCYLYYGWISKSPYRTYKTKRLRI
jgi:hypothetical protein